MSNPTPKRLSPFTVRLTAAQRARLERDAAGMSLGAYVKWKLFDPASPPPRKRSKAPLKDHQLLSRVLGMLGASRLSNNLNQIARAMNAGAFPSTPETQEYVRRACAEIAEMRHMLLAALGHEERGP